MKAELEELYKYRELLYMITYRDIKVRYKQSIMGFFWAILMPIMIVMSGLVVRFAYAVVAHTPLKTADIAGVAVRRSLGPSSSRAYVLRAIASAQMPI